TVGAFMRQLRSMADDVRQEFSDGLEVADEPDDEELAAITEEDYDAVPAESQGDVTEAERDSEESSNGRREPPPDHPVAEAIKSERDAKGTGREA
ncbi:MAG: hypothetical protein M3124_02685, partial [Actinomycetota bacterium]|nr:hypothetical protein [Actinomycetota bacterium]